ncbi:MAG: hypothetical protein V3V62_06080, partial [bacterium]
MEPEASGPLAPDPPAGPLSGGRADLKGMEEEGLEAFCRGLGEPAYRGRQLFSWIYGKGESRFGEMTDLSKALRERLAGCARVGVLSPERVEQAADGTHKYVW